MLLTDVETLANAAMDETGNTLNWLFNHEKEARELGEKGLWDTKLRKMGALCAGHSFRGERETVWGPGRNRVDLSCSILSVVLRFGG